MDLESPCRAFSCGRLKTLRDFLNEHPQLLSYLPSASHHAYLNLCGTISHLRSRLAREFFREVFNEMEALRANSKKDLVLRGALLLASLSWTLVKPYFDTVRSIPLDDDLIEEWFIFVRRLASRDMDVALAFLVQTPKAVRSLGQGSLLPWGEQALEALKAGRPMWKAARAYLEESVEEQCPVTLTGWKSYLEMAERIAAVSPDVAESFIRVGTRVCLLLDSRETEQWVSQGLGTCGSERELASYFSGTSLKALEIRDGLVSGVTLKGRSNVLSIICEAVLGRPVKIRSNAGLRGIKGFRGGAATDGRTIYLPDMAPCFGLFKLMALHQCVLLDSETWLSNASRGIAEARKIHLEADQRLLDKLPGLWAEMDCQVEGGLPRSYPAALGDIFSLPWWGDLLPHLVRETESTILLLKEKAAEHQDLPPEVIEALAATMMADGERDPGGLWQRLKEMLDSVEFTSPDAEDLQESFKTFFYREWDADLADYKLDWCLVRERWLSADPNSFVEDVLTRLHGLIVLIRRQFMRLKPERFRKLRAQDKGDDLDLDALVQSFVDMRSGCSFSDDVYIRRDKRIRDVAVLFLVDMTGSTAEEVHGRKIIDIHKEAMVLMAEALDSLGDPFAIYGFSSEGRFRIDLFCVKDFGEPYGELSRYRLGAIEPRGLTRLGAFIRHGIHKLDGIQATIKLMVVLTDGRPYDLEYGNFDYSIADTRKAMQEARNHRIHAFIITTDKKGATYMGRISPQTQSIIVPKVELLPTMLPAIYKRLTA